MQFSRDVQLVCDIPLREPYILILRPTDVVVVILTLCFRPHIWLEPDVGIPTLMLLFLFFLPSV